VTNLWSVDGGEEEGKSVDLGILFMRVLFGVAIASHGAQKLFGWFGGKGLKGTGDLFESLRFRPGVVFAAVAGLSELVGGLLLLLGLFTPLSAAAVMAAMLVAMVSVHLRNGFFAANDGIELAFLYAAAALGVAFTGGGAYSLDALLGLRFLAEPYVVSAILALTIIGVVITMVIRRHEHPQRAATL
jgi:putative oxidoreductase